MKNTNLLLALGLSLGLAGVVHAAPVCDGSNPCENPGATAQSPTLNASNVAGLRALNSSGSNGNLTTANYWFAFSTVDLGATVANGGVTNSGTGTRVVGVTPAHPSASTPASLLTTGRVDGTKGGTAYWLYAQACPAGTAANTPASDCSQWVKVSASQITTTNYPTSVFQAAPTKPADASITSISVRTTVPAGDLTAVSSLTNQEVDDLITPANNQSIAQIAYTGNGSPYVIDNSLFTNGFKPNNKYQYKGQVQYPWDVVPVAGVQTVATFWTTPTQPGAVSVSNITHCSAQITSLNATSGGSTIPNPAYTIYNLCATGTGGSCATDQISGATFGDSAVATVNNLNPNTNYTPNATGLVGNGSDSTATGWNNSVVRNGSVFTTLSWGGAFTLPMVGVTSATLDVASITGAASIATWSIRYNGGSGTILASGSGDPTGSHTVTGLIPNTVYPNVVIVLTETSGCSSTLSFSPNAFTTTPLPPTTPASFSNVVATSLQVNWTNPAANSAGTNYRVELCTTPSFTGCQTASTTSAFRTFTVNPVTTYYARVKALNRTGSPWDDSAYLDIGNVTTPPNQSGISVNPNPGSGVTGSPLTFTATVTDQTGTAIPGQAVNWSYSNGNGQLSTLNGVSTNLTATSAGNFTLTASLSGYTSVNVPVAISNAGPVITGTPSVNMNPDGITADLDCLASDPGYAESALTYSWSLISPTGAPVSYSINGTNASKHSVATLTQSGNYIFRCTATDPATLSRFGDTPATLRSQILKSLSVSPNNVTINVFNTQAFSATGTDQFGAAMAPGSVTWSSSAGNVSGAGVFQPSNLGSNIRVTATNGAISGFAVVSVVNFDVSTAYAFPVPYKSTMGSPMCFKNLGTDAKIRIYTTSGRLVYNTEVLNADNTVPCPFPWNVKNNAGENLASGIYLYVIESPTTTKHGKLIIIQ